MATARWRLAMKAASLALAAAASMSLTCIFDTETHQCASGRRCKPSQTCAADQNVCIDIGGCGDGVVSPERDEICDDGNIMSGDGCSSDCRSYETCGNGIIDFAVRETCDDGNTTLGDGCNAECQLESCGNRILDDDELCDDGNTVSGDGCRGDCRSNEICGNGILDREMDAAGTLILAEECDPGDPATPPAMCDSDCTWAMCGDGHHNPFFVNPDTLLAEQCDTGGDSEGCDSDCTFATCGDGYTNTAAGEGCDFSGQDTQMCNAICTPAQCGDRYFNPQAHEQCDTGGNTAACDSDCTIPVCGDGHWNPMFITDPLTNRTEECDDGNSSNNDHCVADCTASRCGDGFINRRTDAQGEQIETCEDTSDTDTDLGCSLNFPNCSADCTSCS